MERYLVAALLSVSQFDPPATMLKLLKQILNEEDQDLKRYALILLLLASGALASTYLSHHLRPGTGLPDFTVHAAL